MPAPMFIQGLTSNEALRAHEVRRTLSRLVNSGPLGQNQAIRLVQEMMLTTEGQNLLRDAARKTVRLMESDYLSSRGSRPSYDLKPGSASLNFGNGLQGRRIPAHEALKLAYRVGNGQSGNWPPR
jgi:hypothetical protein